MRAEYDLQPDDVVAFYLYHNAHAPENRRARRNTFRMGMAALVLVCGTIAVTSRNPAEAFATWWPLVLLPLVFALLPFWHASSAMRKPIEQRVLRSAHASQLGRQEIELTADGLRIRNPYGATELRWGAVRRIASSGEHLFIYIGPEAAVAIPRRGFSCDSGFDAFEAEARRLHAQAGPVAVERAA